MWDLRASLYFILVLTAMIFMHRRMLFLFDVRVKSHDEVLMETGRRYISAMSDLLLYTIWRDEID